MAAIWLVRHAATAWTGGRWCGRSDPPLTPAGVAEAVGLGASLKLLLGPHAAFRSSPALRALATAHALAPGLPVVLDSDLHEVDFGEVDGLTFDELEGRYPHLANRIAGGDLTIDWPGGETASEVRWRATRAWNTLRSASADSTVVAVTHGGLIRAILAEVVAGRHRAADLLEPATAIRLDWDGETCRVGARLSPAVAPVAAESA